MKQIKAFLSERAGRAILCLLLASAATAALADALKLTNAGALLYAATIAGASALLYRALACADARLKRISYILGGFFALCVMIGAPLLRDACFPVYTLLSALRALVGLFCLGMMLGAGVLCAFQLLAALCDRAPKAVLSSGAKAQWRDGLIAFGVTLLCWLPVWLAFWPGTFRYDADTQFLTYMDEYLSTHHPLLHTLLLGWLMNIPDDFYGYADGLALYSIVQMALMACAIGYACAWMTKRRVRPVGKWLVVAFFALSPLYSLWSFSATKDVLFAGAALALLLQLIDLWRERLTIWRGLAFVLTAALMMLLRNNGVYAFCLLLPFAVVMAKGKRARVAALFLVAIAAFGLTNALLVRLTDAESGSAIEMYSIPLQQMGRVAQKGECTDEELAALTELYGESPAAVYWAECADAMKWNINEETFLGDLGKYLSLWLRMGLEHPGTYLEAFFVQNLPYYYPGAPMLYNICLGVNQMEMYTLWEQSRLPALQAAYRAYDSTLTFLGLPATRALSDCALAVWLSVLLLGFAVYRRRKGLTAATIFLLAIWCTCLLGPVAVMRYVLALFYGLPVLLADAATADTTAVRPA